MLGFKKSVKFVRIDAGKRTLDRKWGEERDGLRKIGQGKRAGLYSRGWIGTAIREKHCESDGTETSAIIFWVRASRSTCGFRVAGRARSLLPALSVTPAPVIESHYAKMKTRV